MFSMLIELYIIILCTMEELGSIFMIVLLLLEMRIAFIESLLFKMVYIIKLYVSKYF